VLRAAPLADPWRREYKKEKDRWRRIGLLLIVTMRI
jgi:hypothetical protein